MFVGKIPVPACGKRSFGTHVKRRVVFPERNVAPCFDYRNTRWLAHKQLSKEIDVVQCKTDKTLTRLPVLPHETPEAYARRWNRNVGLLF